MNFKLLKKVLVAIFPCLIVAGVLFFFFHPRTVEIKSEKNGWQIVEEPEFQLEGIKEGAKIKVSLIDPKGTLLLLEEGKDFEIRSSSPTKIKILRNEDKLKPGLYKIKIEIEKEGKTETLEKAFPWGVLAINTNKSIYLPGETAYLQMAALGNDGHTICDANLKLKIKNEKLKIEDELSTADGRIQRSRECGPDNVTDKPDYFAFYQVREPGVYKMTLTNLDNGYEIEDSFEVRESVPFEIERIGPTRIWPKTPYEMVLKIRANQDFKGKVIETVPRDFLIVECQNCSPLEKPIQDFKEWAFNIEMKNGESYELKYKFDAPDTSPYLYLLGPLKIGDFQESRQWQIAADDVFGPNSPSSVVDDSYTGIVAWTNPQNATNSDNVYASVTLKNSTSHYLKATGFGFNIPSGTTINGIVVEVERYASSINITDNSVVIVKNGNLGTTNRAGGAWSTTEGYVTYGSSTDLWGETWTAADINASNFGVAISAKNAKNSSYTAYVDHIRIKVYYTPITVSGYAYEATTVWSGCDGTSKNVALAVNGSLTATTSCSTSTGAFQFSNVTQPATSTPMVIYFKGVSGNYGSNVNRYFGSGNVTGIVVRKNAVIVQHDDSGPITNADMGTYDNDNDADINYAVDASNNLTVEAGSKLIINSNDTFTPGGTVTIENGDLLMMSSSTLTANNSVTVNGDLSISSGATLNGMSSVTVNGGDATGEGTINLTGGTFTLDGAGNFGGNSNWTFYDLTFGGDSNVETTVATGTGEITVSNVLTIGQNQTLNAGSKKWNLLGLGTPFVINGNFNASSSTFTYIGGWRYRKSVTISNSTSALTDYQVSVTLDTVALISAGKMQSDCDDIRFTDTDGVTNLNYWLESGCNTTSTKIWVKVPSIPASSTKTIYVYYGNPSATSASNGSATFIFFDDFSTDPSTRYDFYNWYYSPTWSWDSTNQWILIKTLSTYGVMGVLHKTLSLQDMALEINLYSESGSNSWIGLLARYTGTTEGDGLRGVYNYYEQQLELRGTNIADVNMAAPARNNWYKMVWKMSGTSHVLQFWSGNTLLGENSGTQTTTVNTGRLGFGAYYEDIRYDNFRVRKYIPPEPTTSVGNEETSLTYVTPTTYNNLEILPQIDGLTFIFGTGAGQTITTNGYLTIGNGTTTETTTADTYDPILDINGNFTISSNATFIASNSSIAYFAKNWTNNGTFVHSTGTIVFDDSTTSTLSGVTTFYNFTCTTLNKVLQFPAGTSSTTTIEGTLTLNGGNCSSQIKLRSSTDGSQWYINALATSSINYVDVKDSYAIIPLTAYYSTDSGNNTNWTIYPCVAGAIRIKGSTNLEGRVRLK
jgi:hypothetical protein